MQEYLTACPRNCYSTCSFRVWVDHGRVARIEPEPLNLSTPEGICLKGLSYIERANSEQRLLYPLRKKGTSFHRISWDEALDELSGKLQYYKDKYGSHSILFYAASGMSGLLNEVSMHFWRLFGGTTTVYGNLCWPAGLEATRLTLGANKHNVPWDVENSRLIIIWGKNPAECNIQQMIFIERAQRKGAKLVVIDPRRTPSAERADLLIQPKPGTDGLLALALAKIIIEKGAHNQNFITGNVKGFDAFARSLSGLNVNEVETECGIPLHLLNMLADLIAEFQPMMIMPGYGMQRYTNGGQTMRCLLSLIAITGNIGKPGAGWQYANLQSYVFDKVKEPESYFPDQENDRPFRRVIPTARLGRAMLQLGDPELKMSWVERGNPVTQNPDSKSTLEAFRKLEYRVVVEQFMTDTALEADLVLPAKTMFEQSDIIGSYWNPYVQLKQKVVDPPGEVKPETEIYYLLARKLGMKPEEIQQNIPEPTDEAIDKWLTNKMKPFPSLSLEGLKKAPRLAPGLEEVAFSDGKFPTPSGKIELQSEEAQEKWGVSPLPVYVKLAEGQDEPKLGGSQGKDKLYPLTLLSPNTKNRIHSQFGNLETIRVLDPVPYMVMSPADAITRGLEESQRARVFNARGSLEIPIKLDYSLRPGNVVIYNGYWNQEGANPNNLSLGRETDMGFGSAFHDNMVEVEKV